MAKGLSKETPTTLKNKKFIKNVVKEGNVSKAATLSGYQPDYGSYLMKQPKIQSELQSALERAGLGDDVIASKIAEGLESTFVKKDGGTTYKDYHAIHKYLDMAIKIGGGFAPEKHEIRQEKLTLIVTPEVIKGLEDSKVLTKAEAEVIYSERLKETLDDG